MSVIPLPRPEEDKERRFLNIAVAELRVVPKDGDKPVVEGYAAVFDKLSEDLGGFREKIAPGAFKKSLKGSDTRLLYNHDQNIVLGRTKAGTLEINEDKHGLHIRANPPEWAGYIIESVERGDVDQMSFGFYVERDEWDHDKNIRTILDVAELIDVSIVTFPAYPQTEVALRSLEKSKPTITDDLRTHDSQSVDVVPAYTRWGDTGSIIEDTRRLFADKEDSKQ